MRLSVLIIALLLAVPAYGGAPKYPVVFAHGILASKQIISWKRVKTYLSIQGYDVHLAEVSGVAEIKERAKQLRPQLKRIMAQTQSDRVNLIVKKLNPNWPRPIRRE